MLFRSYPGVLEAVRAGGFTLEQRRALASLAFQHTASYDVAVASWFAGTYDRSDAVEQFPAWLGQTWQRSSVLRYGENPHQGAALYLDASGGGLAAAEQLHGKEMSYNNYVDSDAAWRAAHDHGDQPTVAIIKHMNPCGIAVGTDVAQAHAKAHACDPVSAFGGVTATNVPVSLAMAEQVKDVFTEVVLAPGYEDGAVELLARKPSIRLLVVPDGAPNPVERRPVSGGLLVQVADRLQAPGDDASTWTLATGEPVEDLAELEFAWRAVRAVKSNAILLVSGGATVGVGMGQVNRVDSARLAVARAGERAAGSVAASDAFFPFPDGLEVLLEAGVRVVVQPGGSVRDDEAIAAAKAAGATMYLTGTRHFAH